jgi:hypothetical protein
MKEQKAIPVPSDVFVVTDATSWAYIDYSDLSRPDIYNKIVG